MALGGFPVLIGEGGLTADDSTAKQEPGTLGVDPSNGNIYRYVQISEDATPTTVEGAVCLFDAASTATDWVVTPDVSDSAFSAGARPVGVAQQTHTAGNYGWILVQGVGEVRTDGGVSAGDYLVSHSADQEADTMAAGEEHQVFAEALEADSTTTPEKALSQIFCL